MQPLHTIQTPVATPNTQIQHNSANLQQSQPPIDLSLNLTHSHNKPANISKTKTNNNNFNISKFNYNTLIMQLNSNTTGGPKPNNQPSEALAHFMFEFSKTILSKAGGYYIVLVFLLNGY